MANTQIGKIKKVPLRELWQREDKDFTQWLENNIDFLNDVLEFDITIISREEKVGPFNVDLYGEDHNGHKVIIENQLEKTDHDHLGKLITYLTNLEANTAIWITSGPVEEHIKAIDWLNEVTPDDIAFYLIKVEAIFIESQPIAAPLFTVLKSPNRESKEIGKEKKEYAQRHVLRKDFWGKLLERMKKKTNMFANISPGIYSWIGTGAGKSGISYNFSITYNYGSCEIYLDRGKNYVEPNINKIRFDKLYKKKDIIEKALGFKLSWERLNEKRASRISVKIASGGLKNEDSWEKLHRKMIDSMISIESVFRKYIKKLG